MIITNMRQLVFSLVCLTGIGLSLSCNATPQRSVEAQVIAQETPTPEPAPTATPLTEKDLKRRAEIHEKMLRGEYLHDGALELKYIGDITSVPALLVVLKKHPPAPDGLMVCTTGHALDALRKLTGANPGIRYEDWNVWWQSYQQTHKPNNE